MSFGNDKPYLVGERKFELERCELEENANGMPNMPLHVGKSKASGLLWFVVSYFG